MAPSSFQLRFLNNDLAGAIADSQHPFWRRRHPRLYKRTKSVLDLLTEAPYSAARSHMLRFEWTGLRSATLVDQWRLIFKVCDECRRMGLGSQNPIDCCNGSQKTGDGTINVIEVSDHYG